MRFWANLIGYQIVWFAAVIGASRASPWPGLTLAAVFVLGQAWMSANWRADLRLVAVALCCGVALDGVLGASGWALYAAPWPALPLGGAPAWILALWASFAMTFNHSLRYLRDRPASGALLGLVGGPLAYWGAGKTWGAIQFAEPVWRGLAWLALGWALAMFLLCKLAGRWDRDLRPPASSAAGAAR